MTMLPSKLLVLSLFCVATGASAQAIFTDTFSGSTIDSAKWASTTPFSDSSIAVSSSLASFSNGSGLLTQTGFSQPIEIAFSFAFTGTSHDSFRIVTRADAFSSVGYGVVNGVAASFRIQEDTGNLSGNIALEDNGAVLATATVALSLNTWYTARLQDDGVSLSLYWAADTNPLITAAVSSAYGNRVATFNREGAGNNSTISAGSVSSIDYITVTSIPEPGAYGLVFSSVMAVGALRGRCKRAASICRA